jgi:hypothetical protein
MAPRRAHHFRNRTQTWRRLGSWIAAGVFSCALTCGLADPSLAQAPPSVVLVSGNAAVTGFSGALAPMQIAPGEDPSQITFIDPNGASLRIVDLQRMGGPAAAQLVGAPKPFTFPAAQLGQVFGVAADDASAPNIYAAASSAYGLPIVAPGPDGKPRHVRAGTAGASFMPGLWGPQGGPGSIWKIDGATARVSVFATVSTNGRPNSGAALGGLAYDPDTKSLFVADRESGLIHRFTLGGADAGSYDHGVTGRAAQGLPPAPWTPPPPLDVSSAQFDSGDSATWNYAPPERRVFGLAVYAHRLYYAVAEGLQIWSVGVNADGSFADDAVIEVAVPPGSGPTEISKIAFDEQGRMYLADRGAPTGAFDFEALAVSSIGRVLRYATVGFAADGRRIWQQQPDEYAIGFPADLRNGNGGVAIGYNYDGQGNIIPGSCGGFLWATGEDLRASPNAALAAQLGKTGLLNIDGLQGNGTWRIKRNNEPPLASYFIAYVDEFEDPAAHGHMGDIAIVRGCTPAAEPYPSSPPRPPPGAPPIRHGGPGTPPAVPPGKPGTPGTPPSSGCPPNQLRDAGNGSCVPGCSRPNIQVNGKCCSAASLAANAACSNSNCPSGQTAIGPSNFCCNESQVYASANGAPSCCAGQLVNGKCRPPNTPPKSNCPTGYVSIGAACCLAGQVTSTGVCCPSGQVPSGPNNSQCKQRVFIPVGPFCMCGLGQIPTAGGKCCAPANVTTNGVCCSAPVNPSNRASCPAPTPSPGCASGYTKMSDGTCCNNRNVGRDGKTCATQEPSCAKGEFRDAGGTCVPVVSQPCATGETVDNAGNCVRGGPVPPPPPGQQRPAGPPPSATQPRKPVCPPGQVLNARGACVRAGGNLPPRLGPPPPGPRAGAGRPGIR